MINKRLIRSFLLILGMVIILGGCNWFGTYKISGTITDSNGAGISGVTITYQGKINGTNVRTGANGRYTIAKAKGLTTITPHSKDWVFSPSQRKVDKSVTNANFVGTPQYTLDVYSEGNGHVNISPEKERYKSGDQVTLIPVPTEGAEFSHWRGSISSDEEVLTFIMDSSKSITAVFTGAGVGLEFADKNFELAVRDALEKPHGVITAEEVATIENLDASIRPIETIEGIQHLINLSSVNLSVTGIADILPLEGLLSLEDLNLGFNNVDSLGSLKNLPNLQVLLLNDNQLSDLQSLFWASVNNLRELDLSSNKINNITDLIPLKNLEKLSLKKNQIVDITPLAEKVTLRELDLSSNQIVKIEDALKDLSNLEILDLQKNKINNLKELTWLYYDQLQELNLNHNPLGDDLHPLSGMTNLEVLHLKDTQISDLSELTELPGIVELDLSQNQITDIAALSKLTTLENLSLHNNQLTDISPLVDLINLQELTLRNNPDLNLSKDSPADKIIQELIAKGCNVIYDYYQNDAPDLELIGRQTISECDQLTITLNASDPNGDQLTYRAVGDGLDQYFDPISYTFDWTTGYEDAGIYTITFFVSDGDIEISEEVIIEVVNLNRLPVFVNLGDVSVNENQTLEFTLEATDADGQIVSFDATSDQLDLYTAPAKFDQQNGIFSWTPGYDDSGTYEITFIADDGEDTVSQSIILTVNHVNRPPVIQEIGDFSINETETINFQIFASDPDIEDTLSYSITSSPVDLSFAYDPDDQTFSWVTGYDDAGNYLVTITVDDGTTTVSEDVQIEVLNADRPPVLQAIDPKTVDEYVELTFIIHATDEDNDPITYSMTNLVGATLDPQTGVFSWIPNMDDMLASPHQVTFSAQSGSLTDSQTVTITVLNVEHPPVLTEIGPQTIGENEQLEIILEAVDLDKDPISFSAVSSDLDLSDKFDSVNGRFIWTPGYEDSGIYQITFTISDGDQTDNETVVITIEHVNRLPVIEPIGNQSVQELETISFQVVASDLDSQDTLSYWATSQTAGVANYFSSHTQIFEWITDYEDEGMYTVVFHVSDGSAEVTQEVQIEIRKLDRPPVLSPIGDKDVNDNELLTFTLNASDPDSDPITYRMTSLQGATLDQQTGVFSWTPANSQIQVEPYEVTFTAETAEASVSETIQITVHDINHAPVLDPIGDKQIFENQELKFTINYYDVDEDPLTLDVVGDKATYFNQISKTFTWLPNYKEHGTYYLEFFVSDGQEEVSELVKIEVLDVDAAPVIDPLTSYLEINVGATESFTVTASDPDGDTITLSTEGLPETASFDQTGRFEWTPGYDDIGLHTVSFVASANGKLVKEEVVIKVIGAKISVTNFIISTSMLEINKDLTVSVTVQNTGNITSAELNVTWEIFSSSGTPLGTINTGYNPDNPSQQKLTKFAPLAMSSSIQDSWIIKFADLASLVSVNQDFRIQTVVTGSGDGKSDYVDFTVIPEQVTLTVNTIGSGTVVLDPEKNTYDLNSIVTLTAEPDEGSVFSQWSYDSSTETINPINITLDADKIVTAEFDSLDLQGNRLAFISTRDAPVGEIYIMYSNGNIEKITSSTNVTKSNLVWSPHGDKIAYEGIVQGNKEIYVVDVSSKNITNLTKDLAADDISPAWSPDGMQIVYSSDQDGNMDIFRVDSDGTSKRQLTKYNNVEELDPDWFGDLIAYTYDGRLYMMGTSGENPVALTIVTDDAVQRPKWDPDGHSILVEDFSGNIRVIQFTGVADLYESWEFNTVTNSSADSRPVWNPINSDNFIFVSARYGSTDIYQMTKSGVSFEDPSGVTRLTDSIFDDFQPAFNGDGSMIAFVSERDGNFEIYLYDQFDGSTIRLTKNGASENYPVWDPTP